MRNWTRTAFIIATVGLLSGFVSCAARRNSFAAGELQTLIHDGIERSYLVRANHLTGPPARVPLVLVLHGGGGNAANAEQMTGFTDKARSEGFIVVYPQGTSRRRTGRLLTWNAGHCCGYAMENRVNDIAFINVLINRLSADYPVDPKRIYVTGMSNGGMMTHRLGIELSSRLAAIAPVVATLFGDERRPAQPVSAIMLNGMHDTSVPHLGGPPGGRFAAAWDGTPTRPALDQASFWAAANGCSSLSTTRTNGKATLSKYRCPEGTAVELYLIEDNGHAWPGGQPGSRMGDKPSTSFNATDVIWAFFSAHPRVAPDQHPGSAAGVLSAPPTGILKRVTRSTAGSLLTTTAR